jgi:uncharacterized iron-regulated protein
MLAVTIVAQAAAAALPPEYVPQRVYDTRRGAFTDFESMVADLAHADMVFVGEQHDHPGTHRLEEALLAGLLRRKLAPTVSLEMFERDVQGAVDRYLGGSIGEPQFLQESRPWPRYATDYRPLIEMAKREGWTVVAANLPRRVASVLAKSGQSAIEQLPASDRAMMAAQLECPHDAYFARFVEAMTEHSPSNSKATAAAPAPPRGEQRATTDRYYWSQCAKDETMAESVTRAVTARSGNAGPVVHVTGAFHSDFGAGTAERARRRLPGRRITIVSMLPIADLDTAAPGAEDLKRADYLVYTLK